MKNTFPEWMIIGLLLSLIVGAACWLLWGAALLIGTVVTGCFNYVIKLPAFMQVSCIFCIILSILVVYVILSERK